MAIEGEYYLIDIPNLNEAPYVIAPVVLNNKTYYFEYKWSIRSHFAYLSIYILSNNTKIYLIKNIGLVLYNDLTKYIYNDNWSGELYIVPKQLTNKYAYNQQNISTDYQLSYVPV